MKVDNECAERSTVSSAGSKRGAKVEKTPGEHERIIRSGWERMYN